MKKQLHVSLMVVAAMMIGSNASASPREIQEDIAVIESGNSLMLENRSIVGFQAGKAAFVTLAEKYYSEMDALMSSNHNVCDIDSDLAARRTFLANIDQKVDAYSAQLNNLASQVVGNESAAGDQQRVIELKTAMLREMQRSRLENSNPCSGK